MNLPNMLNTPFVFTEHLVDDRCESPLEKIKRAIETVNIYWVPALSIRL